jgi:hypothetical protein
VEPTDFKNVIVENIPSALSLWRPGIAVSVTQRHCVFKPITRWFWNFLSSMTSKTISKPQQPQNLPSGFYFKLHFWNQWLPLIKMHCAVRYLFDFDLKIRSGQVCCQHNCTALKKNENKRNFPFLNKNFYSLIAPGNILWHTWLSVFFQIKWKNTILEIGLKSFIMSSKSLLRMQIKRLHGSTKWSHRFKIIKDKSRGEVSLLEQDTIENVS